MKPYIKQYFLVFLFALLFFSCQDELVEIISPDEQETLVANSTLSNLMLRTSANNVTTDNVLDNSSCFSVDLPVTVVISDITITITTEDDLEELEDLLDDFQGELPEFVFPITIIYSDYEERVIENQEQLEALLEQCFDDDDVIECVDFVYPISFSVFNSEFAIINTVSIEDKEALYSFLERLEDESETLLVGLNFPVTLEYADGEKVTVNTNQELASAIEAAGDDCERDDFITCSVADIKTFLKECSWKLDDEFDGLEVTFNDDFTLSIVGENLANPVTGNWTVEETDNGKYLIFSNLSAFQNDLGGQWLITECDYDDFEIVRGNIDIDLDRNCETDINCSAQDITENLRQCTWFANSNLLSDDQTHKFKFTETNKIVYYNQSTSTFINVGIWNVVIDGMTRKIEFSLSDNLEQLSGLWTLVECNDGFFSLENGNDVFMIEQECYDNVFECYENEDYVLEVCDDDNDGFAQFNIYEAVPSCGGTAQVIITFHTTLSGAENNTDYLEGATSYTNTSNQQMVYVKVALLSNNEENLIYPVKLVVSDCSNGTCSEADVVGILKECKWTISNYTGSTSYNIFNIDFMDNQQLTIASDNESYTGNWITSQDGSVYLEFSDISGGNIQELNGINFKVVECTQEQMIFHDVTNSDNELVLDRDCS